MTESIPHTTTPTLHAQGVSRRYGQHWAVHSLDLALYPGEIVGLLGPNGAGKSSILQMLSGNLAPTTGSVHIHGYSLIDQAQLAKTHLGYLPQTPPLYPELSALDYLRFVAKLHRIPRTHQAAAVSSVIERCGLANVQKRLIAHLSKGYQQRLGIAQAIIHDPQVIILDEPTVGLDPNQIVEIRALIMTLGKDRSVLLSSHILPDIEALCQRAYIMHLGRLVFSGQLPEKNSSSTANSLGQLFADLTQTSEDKATLQTTTEAHQ
jgi:ABC-2 type transport system ATP-binding protein